jgi:simple sugar transport system ATP-binding protein
MKISPPAQIDARPFTKYGLLVKPAMIERAKRLAERYDIRPPEGTLPASALSGGNAQKVVVAREVEIGAKLLIASQPTGAWTSARSNPSRRFCKRSRRGRRGAAGFRGPSGDSVAVGRILVMYEGRITGEMAAAQATEDNLGLLMMGGRARKEATGP